MKIFIGRYKYFIISWISLVLLIYTFYAPGIQDEMLRESTGTEKTDDGIVIFFFQGFYSKETLKDESWRWMGNNSTLFINSPVPQNSKVSIELSSFFQEREITIKTKNDIYSFHVPISDFYIEFPVELEEGRNEIIMSSETICSIPSLIMNSDDDRCLSFSIKSIKITDLT